MESFSGVVAEHREALTALALRRCRGSADAEDLVQDTFERALRAWAHQPPGTNARAWLVTILNRLHIDRCRRARRAPFIYLERPPPRAIEPSTRPIWEAVSARQHRRAMACLDDQLRRVYELYAVEHKTYRDIGRLLGIPPATVGTRLMRARRTLRKVLVAELGAHGDGG
jgi:RNA polymerase sigma-70 factor, ECF subfamily